jgi:hypothetical protein
VIDFNQPDEPMVRFDLEEPKGGHIEMALEEYVDLAKSTKSLEELKIAIFSLAGRKRRAAAKAAA